jgi:hypothetical protein
MCRLIFLFCILLIAGQVQAGVAFDHSTWDDLVKGHVRVLEGGSVSQVDYAGLALKRGELKDYLQRLAAIKVEEFDSWSTDEQLAFLLNAYNSWTVELILGKYPDLRSIKDLGNLIQSPWRKKFIPLFGAMQSLDDIEQGLIRGSDRYKDPRIHFAANCASIGCPALRAEAYNGANLERQLTEATIFFLRDRNRNRLVKGRVLEISPIFKWYRDDFSTGWRSAPASLAGFLIGYAEALDLKDKDVHALISGEIKIEFLDYDWRLNGIP